MTNGRDRTWELAGDLGADPNARVSIGRVRAQRAALVDLGARALRYEALEDFLDDAARIAATGLGCEMSKIAARQPSGELLVVAGWNLKPGVVGFSKALGDASNPAGQALCEKRIVLVPDVRQRPEYHLPPVFEEHGVVASANVPIFAATSVFGVLEVDVRQPRDFDELDLTFLTGVASLIAEAVERLQKHRALRATIDARDTLLREHHHRVRNSYQAMIGLVHRHARDVTPEDARERFAEVERRLFALASLYDHLLGVDQSPRLPLEEYLASLCESVRQFYALDARGIELRFLPGRAALADLQTATSLGLAVNELIANSVEHAFDGDGGTVQVCVRREDDGTTSVIVEDDGRGAGLREGVGISTLRRLLAQAEATLSINEQEPRGTVCRISLLLRHPDTSPEFAGRKPRRAQRQPSATG